jgi:hypothetical protein
MNPIGFVADLEPLPMRVIQYRVAVALLGLLAVIGVIISIFAFMNPRNKDAVNGLVTGLFSPLVALAGGATGFYFGASPDGDGS